MSEEEKKAVESLKIKAEFIGDNYSFGTQGIINLRNELKILLNLIENQQKELEQYKRLAEMNLKDSEEFKENMCEHRCILNNQIMELTEELNMQIEHNKELEATLKQTQDSWFEDTQKLEKEKERNNELEIELSIRDNINIDKLVEKYRYYRRLAASYQANCISKDKIKELLENEIIDIIAFRCIAVEDIEELLEEK